MKEKVKLSLSNLGTKKSTMQLIKKQANQKMLQEKPRREINLNEEGPRSLGKQKSTDLH